MGLRVSLLDGQRSVLFVHAHPDDETISTGALIAEFVARDSRVFLLTCSRGERGEVVDGPLTALAGTEELARERELELERATGILGITERFWLGEPPARVDGLEPRRYRDSGMVWIRPGLAGPADDAADDALSVAPLAEVTADIAALIVRLRPSLVISYDDGGGYGHPDHVRAHDAARAATTATGTAFAEVLEAPAGDEEWFDLPQHLAVVTDALRAHASQLTVHGTEIVHSGGQREAIGTSAGLRLHPHPAV
ncbi:GlcNAc-PI de-N-acetylase [Cryobacterium zongtaii]|uniref:GlcNAc-PI de-N-acetylase n=1 Tax=Cryobacterium zongtaii TaxID=1259217 RepID=A0A2S3ZA11_9MICO|nr:GlcNAc-PI de-N-acetylase [Cryobacterium zongtaii]